MLLAKRPIGTIGIMGGLLSVPTDFCMSLARMVQYNTEYLCQSGEYIHLDVAGTSYHAWARNGLADRMLGEFLLMLDTDQIFEPDLLCRLLSLMNQSDIDVLTGIYRYKVPPYYPVIYHWDQKIGYRIISSWDKDAELFEVGCAGAGCLLVRGKVFERIRKELCEAPFDPIVPYSEDFSFFRRLRSLAIKAWCAPAIQTGHLVNQPVTVQQNEHDKHPDTSISAIAAHP